MFIERRLILWTVLVPTLAFLGFSGAPGDQGVSLRSSQGQPVIERVDEFGGDANTGPAALHFPVDIEGLIAFYSNRDRNLEIYTMKADGSDPVNLTNHSSWDRSPDWSPDGKKIAFYSNRDFNFEIYVMNPDGSNPINLTNHPEWDFHSEYSPQCGGITHCFHHFPEATAGRGEPSSGL